MESANGKIFQNAFLEAIQIMGSKTVFAEEYTAGPFRFELLKDGHKQLRMRITGDINVNDPWIKERMDAYKHSILCVVFVLPALPISIPEGFVVDGETLICGKKAFF